MQQQQLKLNLWWKRFGISVFVNIVVLLFLIKNQNILDSFPIVLILMPFGFAMQFCLAYICKERALISGWKDTLPFTLAGFFGGIWGVIYTYSLTSSQRPSASQILLSCPHCGNKYDPSIYRNDISIGQCDSCKKEILIR